VAAFSAACADRIGTHSHEPDQAEKVERRVDAKCGEQQRTEGNIHSAYAECFFRPTTDPLVVLSVPLFRRFRHTSILHRADDLGLVGGLQGRSRMFAHAHEDAERKIFRQ